MVHQMRFDNLESFLKYFYENECNIAEIEFNFSTMADPENLAATPDVVAEPIVEPEPEEELQKLQEYITIRLPSGDVQVQLNDEGYMVVDDFAMTPNACGTGYIVVEGRKLHLDMCEMEGKTVAYLHTTKGHNEAVAVRRKK